MKGFVFAEEFLAVAPARVATGHSVTFPRLGLGLDRAEEGF